MLKTFKISWSIENTYRTNAIINSFKSIPFIGKHLPMDEFYKIAPLKIFAGFLSVLWEIGTTFFGKLAYVLVLMALSGILAEFSKASVATIFVHCYILLTILGTFLNNQLFDVDNICLI